VSPDYRQDRIGSALRGENPTVLRRLPLSFAVIGDVQWLPGYCVLLVDRLGVGRLTDLARPERLEFLASMERLGEAVENACRDVTSGYRRVNLEILGNTDEFLHAHVWPRYDWEPPERVAKPVWLYPAEYWTREDVRLGPQQDDLRRAIAQQLDRLSRDGASPGT
jgi:diadenosine tetraphosphate (Ap4A) HIT family hydrolase